MSKGAYIPKIEVGANTRLLFNFGPNFTFDTDSLCEQLSIESCIIVRFDLIHNVRKTVDLIVSVGRR